MRTHSYVRLLEAGDPVMRGFYGGDRRWRPADVVDHHARPLRRYGHWQATARRLAEISGGRWAEVYPCSTYAVARTQLWKLNTGRVLQWDPARFEATHARVWRDGRESWVIVARTRC